MAAVHLELVRAEEIVAGSISLEQGEIALANSFFGKMSDFYLVCIGCVDKFGRKGKLTCNSIGGGESTRLEGEFETKANVVYEV